jgi:phosphoglucomutase
MRYLAACAVREMPISGTNPIYKLYAESLKSADHLAAIVEQAQEIVSRAIGRK